MLTLCKEIVHSVVLVNLRSCVSPRLYPSCLGREEVSLLIDYKPRWSPKSVAKPLFMFRARIQWSCGKYVQDPPQ